MKTTINEQYAALKLYDYHTSINLFKKVVDSYLALEGEKDLRSFIQDNFYTCSWTFPKGYANFFNGFTGFITDPRFGLYLTKVKGGSTTGQSSFISVSINEKKEIVVESDPVETSLEFNKLSKDLDEEGILKWIIITIVKLYDSHVGNISDGYEDGYGPIGYMRDLKMFVSNSNLVKIDFSKIENFDKCYKLLEQSRRKENSFTAALFIYIYLALEQHGYAKELNNREYITRITADALTMSWLTYNKLSVHWDVDIFLRESFLYTDYKERCPTSSDLQYIIDDFEMIDNVFRSKK